jgi:hypothetical protein
MFDALVFSTVNALEFSEIRRNVIRIPEVMHRVRDTQTIWDQVCDRTLDLANFIGSDDQGFLGNLRLKNLATAVIQLGLLDRLMKTTELPEWLMGLSNGDAPLRVASRQETFEELVRGSQALSAIRPQSLPGLGGLPILAGVSLAEFSVLKKDETGFRPALEHEMDLRKAMKTLIDGANAKRIVVVGPGHSHVQMMAREVGGKQIEVIDSVSLDPVLFWFYTEPTERPALAVQ